MRYRSTRSEEFCDGAAQVILAGPAPDGGLYVPSEFPQIEPGKLAGMRYDEMAAYIMGLYLTDYPKEFLAAAAKQAYQSFGKNAGFLRQAADGALYLELWHGPTCAFKDYALQMMPHLLMKSKELLGISQVVRILTATSGDTGTAALEGYANKPGIELMVFYPQNGTSELQKLQMVTTSAENAQVYEVKGSFDDAQYGVKRILADRALAEECYKKGKLLTSANSINWGRLVPQIVYYFYAYEQLVARGDIERGATVDFAVPTGNFGNILAGYYAKKMGLPVEQLICASNENCVLTEFFASGIYNANRPFFRTQSPSMDILVSSNLERLLFDISGDCRAVSEWMRQLRYSGCYRIPQQLLRELQKLFCGVSVTGSEASQVMREVFHNTGYVIDPHTAVAAYAEKLCRNRTRPCIIVSTASAYKFPNEVLYSLGYEPEKTESEAVSRLELLTRQQAPQILTDLLQRPVRFEAVIAKQDMVRCVME